MGSCNVRVTIDNDRAYLQNHYKLRKKVLSRTLKGFSAQRSVLEPLNVQCRTFCKKFYVELLLKNLKRFLSKMSWFFDNRSNKAKTFATSSGIEPKPAIL